MSRGEGGEALLLDPYHPYAVGLIAAARRRGHGVVCLYSDAAEARRQVQKFPDLEGNAVAASYLIEGRSPAQVADHLRRHHDVVAVMPHVEPSVLPLCRIAEQLALPGFPYDVVERFRDKHALKALLREVPDGPRINAIAEITGPEDVRAALATGEFDRFVLKPNDGYGNSRIGFFAADEPPAAYEAYLRERSGTRVLMEEFIDGPEFFVNGQVDADGDPEVFSVWTYVRQDLNSTRGVSVGDISLLTSDPAFDAVRGYAEQVMRATGLRSSPFHLEAKVDDRGACLIEVGARLVGGGLALIDPLLHGSLDMIDLAAHYYLGGASVPSGVDWQHYDSARLATINGVSTTTGMVYEVEGLAEAEAQPDFVAWSQRPKVGDRMVPTVDLLRRPWRAVVRLGPGGDYQEAFDRFSGLVRINTTSTGPRRLARRALAYRPLVASKVRGTLRPPRSLVPIP